MLSIACGLQILGEKCADTPRGNERSSEKKSTESPGALAIQFLFRGPGRRLEKKSYTSGIR